MNIPIDVTWKLARQNTGHGYIHQSPRPVPTPLLFWLLRVLLGPLATVGHVAVVLVAEGQLRTFGNRV